MKGRGDPFQADDDNDDDDSDDDDDDGDALFIFLAVQNSSIGLIVPWSGTTNNQSLHNTTE